MMGIQAKERDGSNTFYFPELDSIDTTIDDLKKRIVKELNKLKGIKEPDLKVEDIEILKSHTAEVYKLAKTDDSKVSVEAGYKGVVDFKIYHKTKVVAREINGTRMLTFPGKSLAKTTVPEMIQEIAKKLHLPAEQIELCDSKNKKVQDEWYVYYIDDKEQKKKETCHDEFSAQEKFKN